MTMFAKRTIIAALALPLVLGACGSTGGGSCRRRRGFIVQLTKLFLIQPCLQTID